MKAEKHQCAKTVYRAHGSWGGSPCRVNASVWENGKWWCKHHAQSNVDEKRRQNGLQWEKERKWVNSLSNAERAVRDAKDACVEYVRKSALAGVESGVRLRNVLDAAIATLEKVRSEKP